MRRATAGLSFASEGNNKFQSTLSMRRATSTIIFPISPAAFQSTLSMRRATGEYGEETEVEEYFNPRSP